MDLRGLPALILSASAPILFDAFLFSNTYILHFITSTKTVFLPSIFPFFLPFFISTSISVEQLDSIFNDAVRIMDALCLLTLVKKKIDLIS